MRSGFTMNGAILIVVLAWGLNIHGRHTPQTALAILRSLTRNRRLPSPKSAAGRESRRREDLTGRRSFNRCRQPARQVLTTAPESATMARLARVADSSVAARCGWVVYDSAIPYRGLRTCHGSKGQSNN